MTIIHRKINLQGSPGRMFVVGDLHGAYEPLMVALNQVGFQPGVDFLFSVGDLVDRGPKNLELLRLFHSEPNFHAVRGNHEEMIVDGEHSMHAANGGAWYAFLGAREVDEVDAILDNMPLVMTVTSPSGRKIGIVHADVMNDWDEFIVALERGNENVHAFAQWSRAGIEHAKRSGQRTVRGIDMVYMGHTPQGAPLRSGNRVWIDTGAWFNERVYLEQVL